jgi:alpha-galactosidase
MRQLSAAARRDVAAQIRFYKAHRPLLQYGDFYRLRSPFAGEGCAWITVSPDREEAMAGDFMGLLRPNSAKPPLRLCGIDAEGLYTVTVRRQKINISSFGGLVNHLLPVHLNPDGLLLKTADKLYRMDTEAESYTAYGSLLMRAGLRFLQDFSGSGYAPQMRLMQDFASRIYFLQKKSAEDAKRPPQEVDS